MLKKLLLVLGTLIGLAAPVHGAGTVPGISMTQQLDSLGKPLNAGKLYLIQAGTTSTPQNCYQDADLTIAWPNPITLDSAGRVPQLFCADGSIKIRLTNSAGVQQLVADNLLVVGPSGGGGGGGSVDPTTILQTGTFISFYGTGAMTGFVRCNGRTIGSATSGASERANADTQALFEYLWGADANLSVSSGRGVSANADWVANKALTLPDCRGRVLAGLDDMGNSAAGRLTSSYFGASATVLGAAGGAESHTLTASQIPAHTHPNTLSDPGHTHSTSNGTQDTVLNGSGGAATVLRFISSGLTFLNTSTTGITINNANNTGGGGAHPIVQPTMLATIYVKL